jgi:DNA-binding MarR family transcriptional regulator/GNAT superfamily N-acetyltransferase
MLAEVRRFNRAVTQRVGALNDSFLATDRPLGEARMLWEIGAEGCEVRTLRNRLALDSGHASRLLRSLEADGMVELAPSASDRRIRVARLTAAGLAERELLDERSDELAASMLAPLDAGQSERLVDAMSTVERLLTYAEVEIRPVDPAHPDVRQCFRAYFDELDRRAESGFDPGVSSRAEPHELRPPGGLVLIAYLREEPVGCGAVRHHPGEASEIKRLWVSSSARGLGLGRRLLTELEALVAQSGAPAARLDTHSALVEAISLYRSTGYREIPPFNEEAFSDYWFEKPLAATESRGSGPAPTA